MSDCIFCKIIQGEIPGKFVKKDDDVVVIHDIRPQAPVHMLVIPVQHIESLRDIEVKDSDLLAKLLLTVKEVSEKAGIDEKGYKVVANNGAGSGQLVFHLHFHILGGWKKSPEWKV